MKGLSPMWMCAHKRFFLLSLLGCGFGFLAIGQNRTGALLNIARTGVVELQDGYRVAYCPLPISPRCFLGIDLNRSKHEPPKIGHPGTVGLIGMASNVLSSKPSFSRYIDFWPRWERTTVYSRLVRGHFSGRGNGKVHHRDYGPVLWSSREDSSRMSL